MPGGPTLPAHRARHWRGCSTTPRVATAVAVLPMARRKRALLVAAGVAVNQCYLFPQRRVSSRAPRNPNLLCSTSRPPAPVPPPAWRPAWRRSSATTPTAPRSLSLWQLTRLRFSEAKMNEYSDKIEELDAILPTKADLCKLFKQ